VDAVQRHRWDLAIAAENAGWEFGDHAAYARHEHGMRHGQITYARLMGLFEAYGNAGALERFHAYDCPVFDLGGRSVVDVAGGPCSLLLRCSRIGPARVVDPGAFPEWVVHRYDEHGIYVAPIPAEDYAYPDGTVDEVWMYNALAHVCDPASVLRAAMKNCRVLRIVEGIECGTDVQHPHSLTAAGLADVLGPGGRVVAPLDPPPAPRGRVFCGVFLSAVNP